MLRTLLTAGLMSLPILAYGLVAAAQTQNKAETGSGGVLQTMEQIQGEYQKLWDGRPGQVVKGAIGAAAIARALGAARDAVTFEGAINRNLQSTGGSTTETSSPTASTGVSSSTATN